MALSLPAGVTVNNSSPLATQSVGIKISQPGINAQRASPTQLIYDSSWPSVASAFTVLLPIGSPGKVAHNLGYPPFTRIYNLDTSGNITSAVVVKAVDSTNVYIQSGTITNAIMVDCSNVDLSRDVDYPTLPTASPVTPYDPNYGIKLTKNGKSAQSTNPRDYALHSRYRSPLIQAVKTQSTMPAGNSSGGGGYIAYVNTGGNATWNYGFIKAGATLASNIGASVGSYFYAAYFSQAYPVTSTDGITTYIQFVSLDQGATLVILRDPFFATTIKQAFY